MKRTVLSFVFGLLLFSCMENENHTSGPVPVGNWSNLDYQENGFVMQKVNQLQENTYGYRFLSDGKLIHRANGSFCGTPPIVTSDYQGTWVKNGDILTLTAPFWGGTQIQEWKITSTTESNLLVEVLSTDFQMQE